MTPLTLPFPLSSQGSGGGKDDGSSAGSRLSEKEEELLRVVDRLRICRGGGGEERSAVVEVVLSPLSKESRRGGESVDWLALLTITFFSGSLGRLMGGVKGTSCVLESVSGLAAMLLELLSLRGQGEAGRRQSGKRLQGSFKHEQERK